MNNVLDTVNVLGEVVDYNTVSLLVIIHETTFILYDEFLHCGSTTWIILAII